MKTNYIKAITLSAVLFVGSLLFANTSLAAPKLYFDPDNTNLGKGTDSQIILKIDVENKSTFGADATLIFPANDFTIKSVTNGGFFSDFSFAQSPGRLEIHGYFSTLYNSKTGNGNFATITVHGDKDSGSGNLSFVCTADSTDTQIIDSNGENILTCSSLNQERITYSSDSNGPTNACGGTCGSNYNCNNGLFCFQGYCRNPDCRTDTSCGCKATTTPTAKASVTTKPSAKPSPTTVGLSKFTTPTPFAGETETPNDDGITYEIDYVKVGVWSALFLLLLLAILALFKKRKGPPQTPYIDESNTGTEPAKVDTNSTPILDSALPAIDDTWKTPTSSSNPPQTPTI